jgi:hypothetical protein
MPTPIPDAIRLRIFGFLRFPPAEKAALWTKLDSAESDDALALFLLEQSDKLSKIAATELDLSTRRAGLIEADVLKWDARASRCAISHARDAIVREMGLQIGYSPEELNLIGGGIEINAF